MGDDIQLSKHCDKPLNPKLSAPGNTIPRSETKTVPVIWSKEPPLLSTASLSEAVANLIGLRQR